MLLAALAAAAIASLSVSSSTELMIASLWFSAFDLGMWPRWWLASPLRCATARAALGRFSSAAGLLCRGLFRPEGDVGDAFLLPSRPMRQRFGYSLLVPGSFSFLGHRLA